MHFLGWKWHDSSNDEEVNICLMAYHEENEVTSHFSYAIERVREQWWRQSQQFKCKSLWKEEKYMLKEIVEEMMLLVVFGLKDECKFCTNLLKTG